MEKLGVNEIREKFLSFFESKGCLRLDSFSLVPKNDASLLLINSGMAPLKPWFTGAQTPPRKRVTTCQKCIRTPDIENVGKTARHGTFFEMLGNFSFGDYFKHEAISWAWEFLTEVIGLSAEDLWITVYEEDDEARDIWVNEIGVKPERVVKMGKEDNFWEHGTGPCGPCSEIHVDRGAAYGCGKPDCKIGCDCDRFMEVWNLVFTQFDKDEDGNYNRLPNPNIDTGMGLERLAAVVQGVDNLFEVDTVRNIMKKISSFAGINYHDDEKKDISLRVITDHIRSTVMMVSDGVIPSNEGRGYVLRRLLRRAARHGRLLGIKEEFLYKVADTVIDESASGYPELVEKREYIKKIIKIEEERFAATLDKGLAILNDYIADAKKAGKDTLDGSEAFKLNDTYGFPIDLTVELCAEGGLGVDMDGYKAELEKQKSTARAARKDGSSWDGLDNYSFEGAKATEFVGYDSLEAECEVVGLASEGEICSVINADSGIMAVDKTPFYAQMGGQAGDIGSVWKNGEKVARIVNTTKNGDGIYLHEIEATGEISCGDKLVLKVCRKNRLAISRNHSATHLLHRALKDTLGAHVAQAGSEVTAKHLRFDFSHFEAMTPEQLAEVEKKVNEAILDAMPITVRELPIAEAKKLGAAAQFGEKYGEVVRVVSMGDYSVEFCGGTHLSNTAQAGLFKILSEAGVAAGTRRIEAVTGEGVLSYIAEKDALIESCARALKTNLVGEIDKKAEALYNENRENVRKLEALNAKLAGSKADEILAGAFDAAGVRIAVGRADGLSVPDLRTLGDKLKNSPDCDAAVLASVTDGKLMFLATASKDAVAKGVHAGGIIKEITKIAGGSGGGKPDMAQGGGKDISKADDALGAVRAVVENQVG